MNSLKLDRQLKAEAERIVASLEFQGIDLNRHKSSAEGIVYRHLKALMETQLVSGPTRARKE